MLKPFSHLLIHVNAKELEQASQKNDGTTKLEKDLKKITSKRKNFLKHVDFSKPSIMGILNMTPDSFSDGGKFNKGAARSVVKYKTYL